MTTEPASASAPRNIVLLSDGTGNSASTVWRTNVWRTFESLDLRASTQVANYDDGVGTSSFKPLAILGGGFGWGLKRNVLDLYRFLCRNHSDGAHIYAFGFSRGAFTIRVLLGLIASQGIIRCKTESELARLATGAYRAYRAERYHSILHVEWPFRKLRDAGLWIWNKIRCKAPYDRNRNIRPVNIRFVGLYDTVAAYGLPIEEMTRGISQWIWPLELPSRKLGADVERACHAIALDDERTTFHPVLWSERDQKPTAPDSNGRRWTKNERVTQIWFAGMHSNVGGGYPDDSLAHVPLCWMISEAKRSGLKFKETPDADPDALRHAQSAADKDGRLYDSRKGLGGYYRYGPRKIHDLCHMRLSQRPDDEVTIDVPKIHESALMRTVNGAHAYSPIGLPAQYEIVRAVAVDKDGVPTKDSKSVVATDNEILSADNNPFETPQVAKARAQLQEQIWDLVWWRRVVYFLTLGASFYLALFPVLHEIRKAHEFETHLRIVSDTIRLVGGFLPGFASWWLDAFAAKPGSFLVGLVALVLLMLIGVMLGSTINDRMRWLWAQVFDKDNLPRPAAPSGWVYKLRTNSAYRSVHWALKRHVIPLVSALVVIYAGLAVINHVAFDIQDAAGSVCKERAGRPEIKHGETRLVAGFKTSDPCWSSGFSVEEGGRYRLTVIEDPTERWCDKMFPSSSRGFEIGELPDFASRVAMFSAIPMRRLLNRPWFRPVARIGAVGGDEYPLDPETASAYNQPDTDRIVAEFKARRSGELFLYVNDAVLASPAPHAALYNNNSGVAQVCIERLGRAPPGEATVATTEETKECRAPPKPRQPDRGRCMVQFKALSASR